MYTSNLLTNDVEKLRFNLMVCGESGLGKSTFLYSLLHQYKCDDKESPTAFTSTVCEMGRFDAIDSKINMVCNLFEM